MGGNVGFLSSSSGRLRVPVKLQQVTQSSSRVLVGSQGSSQVVAWDTEFHSSHGRELGVPLELGGVFRVHLKLPWGLLSTSPGTSCLVQGCSGGGGSVLLQCVGAYSVVLAWVFTLDIVGVNSVVVVCSGFTSCGVQAPLLWCEVHIY